MPKIAVIGAGISGLICARTLADHGFPVTVFEKSRGVGGRMATRRANDGLRFDHGAQYFTARDERFRRYVESWIHDGIVERWRAQIAVLGNGTVKDYKTNTERLVAGPGMNAICKHLATDLDIRLQTRVAPLSQDGGQWHVAEADGSILGEFEGAVVSAPAGQTAELLKAIPHLSSPASGTPMHECWAMMLAFPSSLQLEYGGAFVHESPLSWIACNSSKPGRNAEPETWVVHASPEWSHAHVNEPVESVTDLLTGEFWKATGLAPRQPHYRSAHRWLYALPPEPLADNCLFDADQMVVACGDWCAGSRVEGAFLSGLAAAGRMLGLLKTNDTPRVLNQQQRTLF